jgi:serine/threonine protein kinase
VLHPMFADVEEARTRFLQEGYVANRVGHSGAVKVLDDDQLADGTPFLVMELLEGESLEARLNKRTTLTPAAVAFAADRVLDVLWSAHAQGIIHRDIKPGNIFLTRDQQVKVLDFGLARVREGAFKGKPTRPGMVLGTVSYMPPEQARAKRELIDARTDLWAVGATMWRALTGQYVHEGRSPQDRLLAAISRHAPPIHSVFPELPPAYAAVVDRALQFQIADRWTDAREMRRALAAAYLSVEGRPLLPAEVMQIQDQRTGMTEIPPPTFDISVQVVFEPDPSSGSVVVEFEDTTGQKERYELRDTGKDSGDELTVMKDVEVVELEK